MNEGREKRANRVKRSSPFHPSRPRRKAAEAKSWYAQAAVRDAIVIAVVATLACLIIEGTKACDRFFEWVTENPAYEADAMVVAFLLAAVGALIYAVRRYREMRQEVRLRLEAEARANSFARRDSLTGLPNRRLFIDELERTLAADEGGEGGALLLVDIAGMRRTNDAYGLAAGDTLLTTMAERIKAAVGSRGVVARMGGDEFACLVRSLASRDELTSFAAQLNHMLEEPCFIGPDIIETGATMGVAQFPQHGRQATELLQAADMALAYGKQARLSCSFFDPKQKTVSRGRDARLRVPSEPTELQPFMINEITDAFFRESCRAALDWPGETSVGVTLFPAQLEDPWLASRVLAVTSSIGFPSSRLVVEIPESALDDRSGPSFANLELLQKAGVRIVLRDVKGRSSRSKARGLKLHYIKLNNALDVALGSKAAGDQALITGSARRRAAG
ncbi:MAG: diguanylate cyclase [Pseudomonadota bacterium]|nr:diguanylate cyclase [Pseudomonadota bacterium]